MAQEDISFEIQRTVVTTRYMTHHTWRKFVLVAGGKEGKDWLRPHLKIRLSWKNSLRVVSILGTIRPIFKKMESTGSYGT
jgi:hypothetical protein